jgi:hypothetical protein
VKRPNSVSKTPKTMNNKPRGKRRSMFTTGIARF